MDAEGVDRSLTRMAHEILERNRGTDNLIIIGIRKGGVPLAERLTEKISAIEGTEIMSGTLDITLYRDDVLTTGIRPPIERTYIPFPLDRMRVVLVDDVLFHGTDDPGSHGRPHGLRKAGTYTAGRPYRQGAPGTSHQG